MPANVFANTGTNVSVLFFDKTKTSDKVILIDASKLGEDYQEDGLKKHRLTPNEIDHIVDVFRNKIPEEDFSVAVSFDDIKEKDYSLYASQYFDVKFDYVDITVEQFDARVSELTEALNETFSIGKALEERILNRTRSLTFKKQ